MNPEIFRILWIDSMLLRQNGNRQQLKNMEKALASRLNRIDVSIDVAESVEDAERMLSDMRNDPPNLIIMGLILSKTPVIENYDMNAGFFLWCKLRRIGTFGNGYREVPMIVWTERGNPEFRATMEEDNHLLWLEKPQTQDRLIEKIVGMIKS